MGDVNSCTVNSWWRVSALVALAAESRLISIVEFMFFHEKKSYFNFNLDIDFPITSTPTGPNCVRIIFNLIEISQLYGMICYSMLSMRSHAHVSINTGVPQIRFLMQIFIHFLLFLHELWLTAHLDQLRSATQ